MISPENLERLASLLWEKRERAIGEATGIPTPFGWDDLSDGYKHIYRQVIEEVMVVAQEMVK